MKKNDIQSLIKQRDEETDSATIAALQARIDAAVDSLPASKKEDTSDIDRLFASFKWTIYLHTAFMSETRFAHTASKEDTKTNIQ